MMIDYDEDDDDDDDDDGQDDDDDDCGREPLSQRLLCSHSSTTGFIQ